MKLMNELCLAVLVRRRDRHRSEQKVTKETLWMEPVNVINLDSYVAHTLTSLSLSQFQ